MRGKLFSREEIYARIWGSEVVVGDLLAGQADFAAVARDGVALAVHGDALLRRSGGLSGVDALEDGLHAADQQFHLDRLGQVVVGPHAEAGQLLLLFAQGREEDDHRVAQLRVLADGAAGLRPVHHGHHHVQQDQVGAVLRRGFQRFGSVLGREYLVTLLDEGVFHEFEDVGFVVDEQDAVAHNFGQCVFGGAPATGWPCAAHILCEVSKFPAKSFGGTGKMVIFARFIYFRIYGTQKRVLRWLLKIRFFLLLRSKSARLLKMCRRQLPK